MVAKFLDDNKPKTSLKKWIRTVLNFIDLTQFQLICQMLATFSRDESERTVSKVRKIKIKFFCCVHPVHKAGARNVSCYRRAMTATKCTKKRDARAKLLPCQSKPVAFCRSCFRRRRCCLSSLLLWSRNFATTVTWRHTRRPSSLTAHAGLSRSRGTKTLGTRVY